MAAPIFGENNGGYLLMDYAASEVINDQFVPMPNESELMYVFSSRPDKELYWSLPVFPGEGIVFNFAVEEPDRNFSCYVKSSTATTIQNYFFSHYKRRHI